MGYLWGDSRKPFGDCLATLHVWHDSDSGILFPARDAPRLDGRFYDEQRAPESAAPFYSTALGGAAMAVRLVSCILCGIAAGLVVHFAYGKKPFFDFTGFEPRASHDTDPNLLMRFLKNLGRNIRATAPWFLAGVLLSALFQRYVPADGFAELFGKSNEGFGVLMAASIGKEVCYY